MRENNIFLPTLKRVKISNYSLYTDDIDYEFIDGLNLIIGGNGVGKTTFISIVKYALIGLYKKDLDVKVYKGEKRLIRGRYANCNTYFRNRTNGIESDKEGCVELWFLIKETSFYVKRSLYNAQILEATYTINGSTHSIGGKSVRQDLYKGYESAGKSDTYVDNLQYNYEKMVAEAANLSDFDDFIFFVNQILLFGESRETILWSRDVQERLLSSFLNDASLEKKRKEYSLEAKYQNSIARHKQEEIKAIVRVIKQIEGKNLKKNGTKTSEIDLSEEIEELEKKKENVNDAREELGKKISAIYRDVSTLSHKINDKERENERIENRINHAYWPGMNPKYAIYKRQYIGNKICPICNADLEEKEIVDEIGKCFFCHTSIETNNGESSELKKINEELKYLMNERIQYEKNITAYEQELKKLDSEYRKIKVRLFSKRNEVRALENTKNSEDEQNESSYKAMLNRIEELKIDKEKASKTSENYEKECRKIMKNIEENMIDITRNISDIFSEFAGSFMRLSCFLTLEKIKDSKMKLFLPVIDNKIRYDAEELSESQRFFVDYSFRMSILSFFYDCASFYICETPDSSLDISYEENAVDIFMKYLEKPNSLILTSNLNNSTFIKYVLKKATKKKVLNLLKYGKISAVQQGHEKLNELSKEIEEICNE